MAHFAKLDKDGVVVSVVVVHNNELLDENGQESEAKGILFCKNVLGKHATWVQTSYNGNFRKHYAGIGYTYDKELDAFIPPQPYPQCVLDTATCTWKYPVPEPTDGKEYYWDAASWKWIERV